MLGVFFVPGFRQLLGALFVLVLCVVGLAVVGLIARAIWRHLEAKKAEDQQFGISRGNPGPGTGPDLVIRSREAFRSTADDKDVTPYVPKYSWSPELLSKLDWKRFEDVVAAYSRELGYEAKTTRIGADGGVDVQLFNEGQPHPVMIIQCKAWDAYKVGVKPVRELFGVMAADKVGNGAFFTTGDFTTEAEEWARDKNLDLVNGREFLNRINQLTPGARQKLLELATKGDYTTPTCPSCGTKMVSRTATKGRSEGSTFWGCRNFPRCKQTFRVSQST